MSNPLTTIPTGSMRAFDNTIQTFDGQNWVSFGDFDLFPDEMASTASEIECIHCGYNEVYIYQTETVVHCIMCDERIYDGGII